MEDKCLECRKWEENMYWSHFQCMHFCQVLDADFQTQLMIPKKFSENLRGKLQEIVTLKGPNGTATWQVKLAASDDALFLKDGWGEFLNAFTVEKNDILVFKYTGNSCFHVLIFDQQSLCEKESAYFIRKCGHSELGIAIQDKKFVTDSVEDATHENSHEDIESVPPKKQKGETYQEKVVAFEEQVTLATTTTTNVSDLKARCEWIPPNKQTGDTYQEKVVGLEEKITLSTTNVTELKTLSESLPTKKQRGETYHEKVVALEENVTLAAATNASVLKAPCETTKQMGETYQEKVVSFEEQVTFAATNVSEPRAQYAPVGVARDRPRTRSWGWEAVKLPPGPVTEKQKVEKKEPKPDNVSYISRRRPVTEEEKEKALLMAKKELTTDCFLVVMRPTHVYKKFFLSMPSEWIAKNLLIYEKQTVRLRAKGKIWVTRLIFSAKRRGGLSYGWKEFALGNCLEEFDVLVFKLANQTHEPVLLDVSIFRVVPETVTSIRVRPTSTKK